MSLKQQCVTFFVVSLTLCGLYYFVYLKETYQEMAWDIHRSYLRGELHTFGAEKTTLNVVRSHVTSYTDVTFSSGISHMDCFNRMYKMLLNDSDISMCKRPKELSSGLFSNIHDVRINRPVGYVTFTITMFDVNNQTKMYGGDVVLVWAEFKSHVDETSKQCIAGKVIDNENGAYTATVDMVWSGETNIYVKIASKFQNACRRTRAIVMYGDSVYAIATPHNVQMKFRNRNITEKTHCSASKAIYGFNKLCNLTKENYNMSFYCGRPKNINLDCEDATLVSAISSFPAGQNKNGIILLPLQEKLHQSVSINFESKLFQTGVPPCLGRNPSETWTETPPTGLGVNDGWKLLRCSHEQLRSPEIIRKCLSGKYIFFQGDSTVRQYFETLVRLGNFTSSIQKKLNFLLFESKENNLMMRWHIHEFPYHCGTSVSSCVADSVKIRLEELANDITITPKREVVVLLTYNAHLQNYHPDVFRSRIRNLVNPIKLLKFMRPNTKILFKGPHPFTYDSKWFDIRTDLVYRDILLQELEPVLEHVIYLDTFSIGVAYNNNELHPHGGMLRGEIDQFLAYFC